MINGVAILGSLIVMMLIAYSISRIQYYKQQATFWKDSAMIICEKYNNQLSKEAMNRVLNGVKIDND